MKYSILFVDDEVEVHQALARLFADEPYNLSFAVNGREALALLEQGAQPTVIVTGQQMPEMTGVEFLREAKKLRPGSIRLMLTGYAELNAAMDAVNSSGIYRYILKPWNDADLKQAVSDAVEYFALAGENKSLAGELARKNRQLEEINSQLEDKIAERTQALKNSYEENLVLIRELESRVVELEGRDRILHHLLTIHELEDSLHITLEVIRQVAALDWAAVYLPEKGRLDLYRAAFHGRDNEYRAEMTAVGETVRQVFGAGRFQLYHENNLSQLFLPVMRGRNCLAVVGAARRWTHRQNALTRDDMDKLAQFTAYIAIAIRDSQLKIDLPAWDNSLDDVLRNYLK